MLLGIVMTILALLSVRKMVKNLDRDVAECVAIKEEIFAKCAEIHALSKKY